MSTKADKIQGTPEALESRFTTVMGHLTNIDKELSNLVNHYNDGQGSLATLRFENSDLSESISTKGFTYGPAYTLIKDDGTKFVLVKNIKDPVFLRQDAELREEMAFEKECMDDMEDQGEESFENFQKRAANQHAFREKKEKEMKEIKSELEEVGDDEILNRFGNANFSVRLYAARNSFNNALESIINIANEMRQLQNKYPK